MLQEIKYFDTACAYPSPVAALFVQALSVSIKQTRHET